jgi:hypothetical protein
MMLTLPWEAVVKLAAALDAAHRPPPNGFSAPRA